ncbi:zinc finger AN1 domain-containing stress-associated protein 12 [Tanacetum coccineum]
MGGGTKAFPDLGKHCQLSDCKQLNFLPFKCNGCEKVFCVEHRSYKFHECSNSDHNSRKVLVCETCSMSMEIPQNSKGGKEEMALILAKHEKYGDCDPNKKRIRLVVLGGHSFQSDHYCKSKNMPAMAAAARVGGGARPFLVSLALRMGQDCGKKNNGSKIMERRTML